jgi:[ribosomal protein S18]-alanine N-acetyltransferase
MKQVKVTSFNMIASLNKHYTTRAMQPEDLSQVAQIDREAFPTQWPPPSFSRELSNKLAHYLVVCTENNTEQTKAKSSDVPPAIHHGLLSGLRRLFSRKNGPKPGTNQTSYVVGMVGLWLLFDEVHIITIAVRQSHQRQGIGEHLLISSIDLAMQLHAEVVTLEVRPSNTGARALYQKYGFKEEGLRRRYYSDNNEDAIIMTTDKFSNKSFQDRFQRLKSEHNKRWAEIRPKSA